MATAITIRKYTVDVSYKINRNSVRNIDRSFRDFEKKLRQLTRRLNRGISLNIDRFTIDRRRLNMALGDALDAASGRLAFEISRFVVNDRNLQASLLRASRRVGRNLNPPNNRPPNNPPPPPPNPQQRNPRVMGGTGATRAGGTAGLAARAYLPLLGLAGGGYGLAQLNQRNQQVVSAQLQSQAVVQQAGGTQAQGAQSFEYLRREADRIGFDYLQASGDYNKLISGLTGAGVGLGESQKVFSGFAELARVNKLDKVTQNRLFRALSQVAGKGKLQAEELKC